MKTIVSILLCISICGCVTAPQGAVVINDCSELKTIQSAKSELFEKVKIGMPLSEFRQLAPDAYVVSQSNEITAYELAYEQKYVTNGDIARHKIPFSPPLTKARIYKQVLWFYFSQDRLVKWGQPNNWPAIPSEKQSGYKTTSTEQKVSANKTSKEEPVENLGRSSSKIEKCSICGKTIPKLEQHFVINEKIVCKDCCAKDKSQKPVAKN